MADIPRYRCLYVTPFSSLSEPIVDIRQQQYSFHDLRLRWGIHDGILLAAAEDAYAFSGRQSVFGLTCYLFLSVDADMQTSTLDFLSCRISQSCRIS